MPSQLCLLGLALRDNQPPRFALIEDPPRIAEATERIARWLKG